MGRYGGNMSDMPDATENAEAEAGKAASDSPPDRLSVDPKSPWFSGEALSRGVGIIFKGTERFNVEEYCVSEGWVRLSMAKTRDRNGNPLTMKLSGPVEPYFKSEASAEQPE
jgi:hypothetical protein